jgi:hypothetical protein
MTLQRAETLRLFGVDYSHKPMLTYADNHADTQRLHYLEAPGTFFGQQFCIPGADLLDCSLIDESQGSGCANSQAPRY